MAACIDGWRGVIGCMARWWRDWLHGVVIGCMGRWRGGGGVMSAGRWRGGGVIGCMWVGVFFTAGIGAFLLSLSLSLSVCVCVCVCVLSLQFHCILLMHPYLRRGL